MDNLTKSIVVILALAIVILYLTGTFSPYAVLASTFIVGVFAGYMNGGKPEDEPVNG